MSTTIVVFFVATIVFLSLVALGFVLLFYRIFSHFYGRIAQKELPKAQKNHKFAIVIPARNESRVIDGILLSIKNQDYPSHLVHTFVIIEDKNDPTVRICSGYENVSVFIRPDLNIKTKGGALKQFFSDKMQQNEYDAYCIFDADNILQPTFVSEINKAYDAGYKICMGYRNSKNWNDGWLAACSAAFFLDINSYLNRVRSRFFKTAVLTGTGYYISHDILAGLLDGCSLETLTEDLEVSIYSALHGIDVFINEKAEFFDEQACLMRESRKQRIRWLSGYHQNASNRRKLIKSAIKKRSLARAELALSAIPVFLCVASVIIYILFSLSLGIAAASLGLDGYVWAFLAALITLVVTYLFLMLWFISLVTGKRRSIDLKLPGAIKAAMMYPVYLFLFVPYYIIYFFKKDAEWTPIEHSKTN